MIRLSTCSVLAVALFLGGCGAPKPPMPSGERFPVNVSNPITQSERNVSFPSRPSVDPFDEASGSVLQPRMPAELSQESQTVRQPSETSASSVDSMGATALQVPVKESSVQFPATPVRQEAAPVSSNEPVTLQPVSSSVPLESQP